MVIPMVTPIAVEYICLLTDKRIVDIEAGFWNLHCRYDNRPVTIREAILQHGLITCWARNKSIMLIEILQDNALVKCQFGVYNGIESSCRSTKTVDAPPRRGKQKNIQAVCCSYLRSQLQENSVTLRKPYRTSLCLESHFYHGKVPSMM